MFRRPGDEGYEKTPTVLYSIPAAAGGASLYDFGLCLLHWLNRKRTGVSLLVPYVSYLRPTV